MIFDFGMYVVDIDIEKTANYHRNDSRITCDCLGCRNFDRAVASFPQEVRQFLERLGADPVKPEVLSIDYAPTKKTMAYSGFYYLCGTILKGREAWTKDEQGMHHVDEQRLLQIRDDYAVYFTEPRHGVVDADFPKPIVELQYVCTLPWLMEEPHSYHNQLGDVDNA